MKKSNPWADLALAIQFLTALLAWLSLTGSLRADGELARLDARDAGVVMKHGDGPNQCDYLGARDVWVWANNATYYMPYDGAGPEGWLACLATSKDLTHWNKLGPVLQLGKPGEDDSASASYGTKWNSSIWEHPTARPRLPAYRRLLT